MKITILGCGGSFGSPLAWNRHGNIDLNNKRNFLTRSSLLIEYKNTNILIDTSPDLRQQLYNSKCTNIDAVLYTHIHSDHTSGVPDMRAMSLINRKIIPAYMPKEMISEMETNYKSNNLKLIFHCFTGSNQLLNFCLENNYYISISGIITFKNASNLRDIIKDAPLDSILIETDSPFLAPEPMRGKVNEPSFVKYTAEYLAKFFNLPLEEFEKITDNNFFNLFTKAKRDNYL